MHEKPRQRKTTEPFLFRLCVQGFIFKGDFVPICIVTLQPLICAINIYFTSYSTFSAKQRKKWARNEYKCKKLRSGCNINIFKNSVLKHTHMLQMSMQLQLQTFFKCQMIDKQCCQLAPTLLFVSAVMQCSFFVFFKILYREPIMTKVSIIYMFQIPRIFAPVRITRTRNVFAITKERKANRTILRWYQQ